MNTHQSVEVALSERLKTTQPKGVVVMAGNSTAYSLISRLGICDGSFGDIVSRIFYTVVIPSQWGVSVPPIRLPRAEKVARLGLFFIWASKGEPDGNQGPCGSADLS